MNVNTSTAKGPRNPEWLLLLFTLPAKQATKRVEVWRKLRRYGALTFRSSGYLLPNTPTNHERFEWLSASIRKYGGQASVVEIVSFDDLPCSELKQLFIDERSKEYEALLGAMKKRKASAFLPRFKRRLEELVDIDFFGSPIRSRVETALAELENPHPKAGSSIRKGKHQFKERIWVTRPRPGIDRVSSAWLIRNHIDPKARFAFTNNVRSMPDVIPFDMFNVGGFTHQGNKCTFETLCTEFGIRERKIKLLAEIIHDADLSDEKYGHKEGYGLDRVLTGWAKQEVDDHELLRRGMELIEGLYQGIR